MSRIAVFGAGAIGCWIGGRLSAGGADVTLVGRPHVMAEQHGVRMSDLHGGTREAKPTLATEAAACADADLVLVTVKSVATEECARALAPVLAKRSVVVSLQNGVRNGRTLRDALPDHRVLAGMVPFNVVRRGPGHYQRTTTGTLMFEASNAIALLSEACLKADLAFELRHDMPAVQWSKLVINLNNAINALSGKSLNDELADRDFRRCVAMCQREALDLLARAEQPLARVTPVPTPWIPTMLNVPNKVFKLLGQSIVTIDPKARSSMAEDLVANRPTEIDYIQGEIVALAARLGRQAPISAALVGLVKDAERGGKRDFTGAELYAALGRP